MADELSFQVSPEFSYRQRKENALALLQRTKKS